MAGCAALTIAALALGGAGTASTALYSPENVKVTSFDGTSLKVNFYPAAGPQVGQTAPTVLERSAWSLPAYPSWLRT